MHHLRFRQIHLDFHTSPAIANIGGKFDAKQWQDALKRGHVDSITTFSKCHHGWSYHPTKVGKAHPHLKGDLLKAQYEAAKEIDVNVPIYISAGVDDVAFADHPEWHEMTAEGKLAGWATSSLQAGFHKMCFNSDYLDYLCEQIEEVVQLYPECDGIFLDIINQRECCCQACLKWMHEHDLDARNSEHRRQCSRAALQRYYERTTAACKSVRDDMPVFHNSGHIPRGRRDLLKYFSHLELESLPTGGWGYDHFPMSAKYCLQLPYDFLGMTGKFHTTWGEFGGYKHPNALRYECAAMLAYGSKCSVGDQLHPEGLMDESTYDIIGQAYSEVEAKEPWCDHVESVADVAMLSSEAMHQMNGTAEGRDNAPDIGASRILLEGHFLFDVVDHENDFDRYKLLVLPDDIRINDQLKTKLDAYLAGGGKLLLTGTSGLGENDADGFAFDIGADWTGQSPFQPDFILPVESLRADFVNQPLVMYKPSQRIKATSGESLGAIFDPYFNREYRHYCSHQHAPPRPDASGYDCGVRKGNIMYLAHPVFSIYQAYGAVAYQEYILKAIRSMLDEPTVEATLPSTARLSLMHQGEQNRYVLHLLYANTINRGGEMQEIEGSPIRPTRSVEVIEELMPLRDATVTLKLPEPISRVTLEPQGQNLPAKIDGNTVSLTVEQFTCHQMVVLHHD